MELGTLKANYVRSSVANQGHQGMFAHTDPSDPALADAVESLGHNLNAFRSGATFGGGPRPLFWAAPASELMSLRARHGGPSRAFGEATRDILGLVHFGSDAILIEALLPDGATRRWHNARPTFADAGTHSRFRHRLDKAPGRCGSGWGCTVDLAKLAGTDPIIDGAAERVVEPVRVQDAWPVRFSLVGEVATARGATLADDDQAFAERLLRGRACSDLVQRLLEVL